jgi:hypothetical protein
MPKDAITRDCGLSARFYDSIFAVEKGAEGGEIGWKQSGELLPGENLAAGAEVG